jgi:hypothetical protein
MKGLHRVPNHFTSGGLGMADNALVHDRFMEERPAAQVSEAVQTPLRLYVELICVNIRVLYLDF